MSNTERVYSRQSSQIIHTPNLDCKPFAFMTLMVLTFWLMLSYITDSYFIVFLIFTNFILLFACCVSLSGYLLRRYVDARRPTPSLVEVSTICARASYVVEDFPPSYEEAVRNPSTASEGHAAVPTCIVCASHCRATKEAPWQNGEVNATASSSERANVEADAVASIPTITGHRLVAPTTTDRNPDVNSSVSSPPSASSPSVTAGEPPPPYVPARDGRDEDAEEDRRLTEEERRRQRKRHRRPKRRPPQPPAVDR